MRVLGGIKMNASTEKIRPAAARWMLLLLVLANVLSVGDRMLLGVVTEPIRLELALSDVQMSLANGLFFVLFHLGGGFVVARLVDRGNRKRILAIGIAVWSLATAATGLAQDFLSLSIARVGLGVAEPRCSPPPCLSFQTCSRRTCAAARWRHSRPAASWV